MDSIFWFVWLQALLFTLGMLVRNRAIYRWHMKMLDQIREAAMHDLARGRSALWRFDALGRDLYQKQLVQFWRGLDSFITPELKRAVRIIEP